MDAGVVAISFTQKYMGFFDKVGFYVCFVCALSASEFPHILHYAN